MAKKYYEKPDFSEAKKRKHSPSKKFFFWSGAIFLILLALIGAIYFLTYGDFFKVRIIEVLGPKLTERGEVLKIIIPRMMPGYPARLFLAPSHMLFWQFAPKHMTSRTIPLFESADIKIDWKRKAVIIEAKERIFFGIACGPEEGSKECFAFDREGVIFGYSPFAEGSLILKTKNDNHFPMFPGSSILPREDWIKSVFETIDILKNVGLNTHMVLIKNYSLEEWEAYTTEGPRIIFSFHFLPKNLADLINNLEQKFEISGLEYIDFRVENRIFYK